MRTLWAPAMPLESVSTSLLMPDMMLSPRYLVMGGRQERKWVCQV